MPISAFSTISIMLAEAVKRGLIPSNPCDKVERLRNNKKKIEILKLEEVRRLFPENYRTIWGDKEIAYAANLLASVTGMRIAEILGLRGEYIFDNYILVCGQYGANGYQDTTKTKENRSIPLLPKMITILQDLMKQNGSGFLFSLNGGATPVSRNYIAAQFNCALQKIGMGEEEIKRRGLTLHSWRHFLNTELQRQGLTIQQVQSVTGHKSERMTEWYNHPDPMNIPNITKAQAAIFTSEEGCEDSEPSEKSNVRAFALVENPEMPERKHA